MIVVDYSQAIISSIMAEIGNRKDVTLDVDLVRHMVVNTIRSHKVRFSKEFGELVIACDSRKYWRKQVFPYYKANRKKARQESGYDWTMIFDAINLIKEELSTYFPYRVVEVEGAEADDIIATLAKWAYTNDYKEGSLIPEPSPFLIVSGDHDFIQLQKYSNVRQYSPIQKKFVKATMPSSHYVLEHIFKGDKGDGVPNVLTSDNAIVEGERQKPVSSEKMKAWIEDPSSMPTDERFKRNFDRNKMLVDLDSIPSDISENIINTFSNPQLTVTRDRNVLLNYFIAKKMKLMIEHLEEF